MALTLTTHDTRFDQLDDSTIARFPQNEATHQWRHVVTNVVGGKEPGVRVELHSLDLHVGDVVLLCSDGLTEMVSEETIAIILQEENDPRIACERLVGEANKTGGKDNITVVVACFGDAESHVD
jgi:protein phosphatase